MDDQVCLLDPSAALVVDASAVINLNATGRAAEILHVIPNQFVVVDSVIGELEQGSLRGWNDASLVSALIAEDLIRRVTLGELGTPCFEGLVVGPAIETLDDGEASTIAYALEVGGIAIIDERKATRICQARFSQMAVVSTVDLLFHPAVENALGRDGIAEALFAALQGARLRVPQKYLSVVVELIGQDRASGCTSLPKIWRNLEFNS